MTKSELIEQLSINNEQLNKRESELIINTIFDSIGGELVQGGRVEIRGFGSFTIRSRDAREARNPKSGDVVMIAEKKTPFFKTGKELRERVNNGKTA
ncbi:MAG: integration host factor subunit beta [Geobacteraceae bacterium]|jgi:integration host factor subunit beta|nr:MAG: integration host factor subunit beta [Deltaproteobacteria bacterium HGW-Deltaproteobacteria-4]RPI68496.1 MAG: integration host factor subunit beta [Geobacteraceae bacterium]